MADDGFEATFRVEISRTAAWERLTSRADDERLWLPGFDSAATLVDADAPNRLEVKKTDEPCAGTNIVVTLTDDAGGTRIHVVQSGFGDFPVPRGLMALGWRLIVADLHTFLSTGVHVGRHLRMWGDLGAHTVEADGGLRVSGVRAGGLADRLGLVDGDLLVGVAGAPITGYADLDTALRVTAAHGIDPGAEWVHDGQLLTQ